MEWSRNPLITFRRKTIKHFLRFQITSISFLRTKTFFLEPLLATSNCFFFPTEIALIHKPRSYLKILYKILADIFEAKRQYNSSGLIYINQKGASTDNKK
jgi:hypothetical protein